MLRDIIYSNKSSINFYKDLKMNIDWHGAADVQGIFGSVVDLELNCTIENRDLRALPVPNATLQKCAKLGLYKYNLPQQWGGLGQGDVAWGRIIEKLSFLSLETSFPFLVSARMGFIKFLIALERDDLNECFLGDLIDGKIGGAFAYTEDADAFSFISKACLEPDGQHYKVSGIKKMVTGGETAELFFVFVRGETADMQIFLIRADDPGVKITPCATHGMRTAGISMIEMNDVRVSRQRLLVDTDGLSFAQRHFLNSRRSLLVTAYLGRARAVIEDVVRYLSTTVRCGQRLIDMQHVQACIGEMHIALESARTMVYYSLQRQDNLKADLYWDPVSSSAKYHATEEINKIVFMALKLTGAWGYLNSSGVGRAHRDFTSVLAGADPQEKLKIDLGGRMIHELDMLTQQTTRKGE